jgi:cytochrome P450
MAAAPFANLLSSVTHSRDNKNSRPAAQIELARSSELYRALRGEIGEDEAVSLVALVATAATETVERLIARCVVVLLRDSALRRELIEHSERLAPFIEEVLRLYPPEPTLVRETTRDLVLNKCLIPSGRRLKVSVAAANRDSAFYHDPERILLDRRERHHYSFGAGVHQCIGAGFARKLCRIALATLLERAPNFTSELPVERITVVDAGGRLLPQELWINLAPPRCGVSSFSSLDS